jgi:hypothetical protein
VPDTPPPVRPVVDRAELRVTERGPFAGAAAHQFERADPTLHHVLQPAWAQPTPEPPAPAPPGEPELRAQLQAALAAQREADITAQQAELAHERAEQHVTRCRQRVADFVDVDAELVEVTAAALRGGTDPALPEALAVRIETRDRARAELTAAEQVLSTLRNERAAATRATGDATKVVDTLAVRLLSFTAEAIAGEWRTLQAEAARRRTALLGFDRLLAGRLLPMPLSVRTALGEITGRDVASADVAPWRRGMEALRADPEAATVEIELAPVVLPPLPVVPHHSPGPVAFAPIHELEAPSLDDGDPYLVQET